MIQAISNIKCFMPIRMLHTNRQGSLPYLGVQDSPKFPDRDVGKSAPLPELRSAVHYRKLLLTNQL